MRGFSISIQGWLKNFHLPKNQPLIPLFEAIIETSLETIRSEEAKIEAAKEILRENAKYKSILFTNGDELVSVVFSILQQLLNYDLSTFADKKKQDF